MSIYGLSPSLWSCGFVIVRIQIITRKTPPILTFEKSEPFNVQQLCMKSDYMK